MIIKLVKLFLIKIISNTKYRTFLNEFKLCGHTIEKKIECLN